jgi:hypothetical protein
MSGCEDCGRIPCQCTDGVAWSLTSPSAEADARAQETDGSERGDSPTPRGVWRAIFEAAITVDMFSGRPVVGKTPPGRFGDPADGHHIDGPRPVRALSLMAGYGSDASELRRLAVEQGWPIHITGVELCEARRRHLEKWCDRVEIADWRAALWKGPAPHIIVTNPDFAHILDNADKTLDAAETMVPTLLQHAPAVLVLHQEQAFLKSKRGREVWRRWPPAASWLIGPASFSGDGKADSRCYWATLWLRGHEGPTSLHLLPELAPSARRWTVPPGSEEPSPEPSPDLPAAPGWTP